MPLRAISRGPEIGHVVRFGVTPRARDLTRASAKPGKRIEIEVPNQPLRRRVPGVPPDLDAALQRKTAANRALTAPSLGGTQFDALTSQDNSDVFGGRVFPPDTNLDVGPTQIVEAVNLLVRVYDKSGTPLTDRFRMSQIFSTLGGICSTDDDGDPVVLYDPLADRWMLTQFAYSTSPGSGQYVTHECIAVSQSGDATGSYWAYDFYGPNTSVFGDYPHLGVWPDGYYMTTNQFTTNFSAWRGGGVFAFERAKMIAGDPSAQVVYFDLYTVDQNIGGMLPSDFDGLIPPPPGTPNTFAYFIATEYGDAKDGLRLFDFHVDWSAPASSTFGERTAQESPLSVAAFNPLTSSGRGNVLQKDGTCSNALDAIPDRLMHRLQYRNLGDGHEVLVANHTVNDNGSTVCSTSGTTFQAAPRLYELERATGAVNAYSIAQQVTFAPDATSRWMGSAASDHDNDIGLGYSASSLTVYPSIRYTGRLASDAANTLETEATQVAGSGIQTDTQYNRWGDYSMLAVDPADDCTFWFGQEYYTAASQASSSRGWVTHIGNFAFPGCGASARGALEVSVTRCGSGAPVSGATVATADGYLRTTDASGVASFDAMAPAGYQVTAANGSDQAADSVTVVAGTTAQLSLCVPLLSAIFSDGFETAGGMCAWSLVQGGEACP